MRATYWICLGLFVGLALGVSGCKDLDQCKDPGKVEACMCGGDDPGARTCQVEYVWSDCDCAAEVPDSGVTGGMGGMMSGGMGGMVSGGMGGMMTGGMGGMTGGMGGMTGGMGGMDPADGGPDSAVTEGPGYVGCEVASAATDCGAGAECRESDTPLLGGDALRVCAPECTTEADCPDAPPGGTATVACTDGHCVLSCELLAPDCPTGMTCSTKGVDATCYKDAI